MANKSVSTGGDDTRATPQGTPPFLSGNQRQGSFQSLPLLLSDHDEAPVLYRRPVPPGCSCLLQNPQETKRNVNTHPDSGP